MDTRKSWELNWSRISQGDIFEIFGYPRVKKMAELYINYMHKDGLVLEAGCGLGQWVEYFKSKDYKITGIDYNLATIEQAKKYSIDCSLSVADVRRLPFQDNSIDTYLSFGVIEHFIEGPDAALKEAYRVLKKGGVAIITVPHRSIFIMLKSPINMLKRSGFLRRILRKEKKIYYYQRYFTRKELREKFLAIGYKKLLEKPVDHIFSLVEFSDIFRDKNTFDGENALAVKLGNLFEKYFPYISAGSNLFILQK